LRATAAIAGAAAEALVPETSFHHWNEASLRDDGLFVVDFMRRQSRFVLPALAGFARRVTALVSRKDDPLQTALDQARAEFVRRQFRGEALELLHRLRDDHDVYISLQAFIELKGQLTAARAGRRRALSTEALLQDEGLFAERERLRGEAKGRDALDLVAGSPALVLLGDAGSGKSTVAHEWEYRLAQSLVDSNASSAATPLDPRLPLLLRASVVVSQLTQWKPDDPESAPAVLDQSPHLLAIGALHLIVDALNELGDDQRQRVADWIVALRTACPQTPVLVCHRQYNYVPGLLPFPVLVLQKVDAAQARQYIRDYLREKGAPGHEERAGTLVRLLLESEDYQQVRNLAQTPLFLWMLVDRYRLTDALPPSRGPLFKDFTRWYLEERYHQEHGEPVPRRYTYEEKARLLGALGYKLVQLRQTELPEPIDEALRPEPLEEIIAAEMLQREGGKLRFLHQSFQEYFAARHFLDHEATDEHTIRARVREHGWHDTLALLIGFGGDKPDVIRLVTDEALRVNAVLTARCLRMAETPDETLLHQFVDSQQQILREARAGEVPHRRAAEALAEYGREPALTALWTVATDPAAPKFSRLTCLERLAAMPAQARFDALAAKLRNELVDNLSRIFDEPAPLAVQEAAIAAVRQAELKEMSNYLAELVQAGEWPLRRAARNACDRLGLKLTPRQQEAFLKACHHRLGPLEEELIKEAVVARYDALNRERVEILRHLATAANLPMLFERRFAFGIHEEVAKIIDEVLDDAAEQPETPNAFALLHSPDEPAAMAAAHRLCKLGDQLPAEAIQGLLDPSLSPRRLSAVAWIAAASEHKSLAEPLEQFIRSLIETVEGPEAMEAFSNLVTALQELDSSRGNRLGAVAELVFVERRWSATSPGASAWRKVSSGIVYLSNEDYNALLESADDVARAAVFALSALGGGALMAAETPLRVRLTDGAMSRFQELAEAEKKPRWSANFVRAAVNVETTALIPWLLTVVDSLSLNDVYETWHDTYGRIEERYRADVLRAIGCLARMLFDKNRGTEAQPAATYLRRQYASLKPDEDRSIVVGLTTALGYLGEWDPILTHLGPGEPWMHRAAVNVFNYWVPGPLAPKPAKEQERAARWILSRLRDDPNLPAQVRSTLTQIKDLLETKLGRHLADAAHP